MPDNTVLGLPPSVLAQVQALAQQNNAPAPVLPVPTQAEAHPAPLAFASPIGDFAPQPEAPSGPIPTPTMAEAHVPGAPGATMAGPAEGPPPGPIPAGIAYNAQPAAADQSARPWEQIQNPALRAALHARLDPGSLDTNDYIALGAGQKGGQYIDQSVLGAMNKNLAKYNALGDKNMALAEQVAQRTEAIGAGQQMAAARLSDMTNAHAAALEAQNAQLAQLRAEHDQYMTQLSSKLDQNAQDYVKAASQVDPNRLMRSGNNQFIAALASAMGAFGAAFLGRSTNEPQRLIDQAIERDIQQQQYGVEAKKAQYTLAQQSYARNQQLFSDQLAAKLATKSEQYEVFAEKFQAVAMRTKGTEQAQGAQNAADGLRMSAIQARQQALALENQALQVRLVRTSTGQPSAADLLTKAAQDKTVVDKAVAGGKGVKLSPQDASFLNKTTEQVSKDAQSIKALKRLHDLNTESNALSRTLHVGKGREADVAEHMARIAFTHAWSGAQSSAPEMNEHLRLIGGGMTAATGESKNVGVDSVIKNRIDDVLTVYQGLPEAAKPAMLQRLRGMLGDDIAAAAARGETSWQSPTDVATKFEKPEP